MEELIELFCLILVIGFIIFIIYYRKAEAGRERQEREICNRELRNIEEFSQKNRPIEEIIGRINLDYKQNTIVIEQLEKIGYYIIEKQTGISPTQFKIFDFLRQKLFGLFGMKEWNKVKKVAYQVFPGSYENVVSAIALSLRDLKREVVYLQDTPKGSKIVAKIPKELLTVIFEVDKGILTFEILPKSNSKTMIIARSEAVTRNYFKRFTNFDWGRGLKALNDVLDKARQHL